MLGDENGAQLFRGSIAGLMEDVFEYAKSVLESGNMLIIFEFDLKHEVPKMEGTTTS